MLDFGRGNDIYGADSDLPIGWIEMYKTPPLSPVRILAPILSAILITMIMLPLWILAVLFGLSTYGCIAISLTRLIQQDYGDADGNAANMLKLKASLLIFYSLVLVQNLLVFYFLFLGVDCVGRIRLVSRTCGFGDWGLGLLRRYCEETRIECQKDTGLPDDWSLITFAARLLECGSTDDYLSAVRVLDTLLTSKVHLLPVLLSKRCAFQNLIMLLGWNYGGDIEIRERAARIVAYVAGEGQFHISQLPGALHCISSLFDTPKLYCAPAALCLPENSEGNCLHIQMDHVKSQASDQSDYQKDHDPGAVDRSIAMVHGTMVNRLCNRSPGSNPGRRLQDGWRRVHAGEVAATGGEGWRRCHGRLAGAHGFGARSTDF